MFGSEVFVEASRLASEVAVAAVVWRRATPATRGSGGGGSLAAAAVSLLLVTEPGQNRAWGMRRSANSFLATVF